MRAAFAEIYNENLCGGGEREGEWEGGIQRVLLSCLASPPAPAAAAAACSYDLLNLTGNPLPLRWNSATGFFIQGMLVVQVRMASSSRACLSSR